MKCLNPGGAELLKHIKYFFRGSLPQTSLAVVIETEEFQCNFTLTEIEGADKFSEGFLGKSKVPFLAAKNGQVIEFADDLDWRKVQDLLRSIAQRC